MAERDFTNREITSMFNNFEGKLDSHIASSLKAHADLMLAVKEGFEKVTNRQDIANGRTSKNEAKILVINTTLALISTVGLPLIGWALWELIHLEKKIETSVQEALVIYEIP